MVLLSWSYYSRLSLERALNLDSAMPHVSTYSQVIHEHNNNQPQAPYGVDYTNFRALYIMACLRSDYDIQCILQEGILAILLLF